MRCVCVLSQRERSDRKYILSLIHIQMCIRDRCYGEKYIERENKRVVEIFKVNNSDNLNEFTGSKNDMMLEKDNESIMSCLLYTSRCV